MAKGQRAGFRVARGTARNTTLKSAEDARRAVLLHQEGRFAEAAEFYASALKRDPANARTRHMLGLCLANCGRLDEAEAALRLAASRLPDDADVAAGLGDVLAQKSGAAEEAMACYERALALKPAHRAARTGLSRLLAVGGSVERLRRQAAEIPDDADTALALGLAMIAAGEDPALAVSQWVQAARRGILTAEQLRTEGGLAHSRVRMVEALALFQAAVAVNPSDAPVHCNIGALLLDMHRLREAAEALQKAFALDPNHALTLLNMAVLYAKDDRYSEALDYYRRTLRIAPGIAAALLGAIKMSQHICQWGGIPGWEAELSRALARGDAENLDPFVLLACNVTPTEHLLAGRIYAQQCRVAPSDRLPPPPPAVPGRRIRIGYLSNDFYGHATAFLAAGMFEQHDRETFETFAYSFSPDDGSSMRRRIEKAFDHFVEIGHLSDGDAARRIREDGIDILVDLKGYTKGCRTQIMVLRPAPVQVNYLGYPGTMGADFIDYVIGDPVVTPFSAAAGFDEKIVQLPDCYQPNDRRREVAETPPTRAECGLPEGAFVFCCFNNTYKITPEMFAAWLRLLDQVPGSVLWLFEANPTARDNLAYEAASRGIEPERLIFAPLVGQGLHLARYAHADLFLDTRPYNAHTTASDALWAGVPVVTLPGDSFPARVAASLLRAVGLPELVTASIEEYEALALALARDPDRRAALRARLREAREHAPLFDTAAFTSGIEAAYKRMHALRCASKPPEAFAVPRAEKGN
ncbi:tetratricopeptide repeat protein [Xanthobacter sp. V0B-10]|uniref:tetratricopeptide repeat protein n=1 Tax=Xanthobacter albus TaxID=3119929 RepID=UPI003726F9FD